MRRSDRCQSSSQQQSSRWSQRHLRLFARARIEVSDGSDLQVKRVFVPTPRLTESVSGASQQEAPRTAVAEGGGRSHRRLTSSENVFTIQHDP
jgi:hypothetical protein